MFVVGGTSTLLNWSKPTWGLTRVEESVNSFLWLMFSFYHSVLYLLLFHVMCWGIIKLYPFDVTHAPFYVAILFTKDIDDYCRSVRIGWDTWCHLLLWLSSKLPFTGSSMYCFLAFSLVTYYWFILGVPYVGVRIILVHECHNFYSPTKWEFYYNIDPTVPFVPIIDKL